MRPRCARLGWAALVAALVASFHGAGVSATLGPVELISRADPSIALTGGGSFWGVRADGRFVVFSSTAGDLDHGQVDFNKVVQRDALALSFIDNFWRLAWIFAAVIPFVLAAGGAGRARPRRVRT